MRWSFVISLAWTAVSIGMLFAPLVRQLVRVIQASGPGL